MNHNKDIPNSALIIKNIIINNHRTSVRLEPEMWSSLEEIAQRERCSVNNLCSIISHCKKPLSSMTSAIRVFVMFYYKAATTENGHMNAKHGRINKQSKK